MLNEVIKKAKHNNKFIFNLKNDLSGYQAESIKNF